jgi:hypothetical protein
LSDFEIEISGAPDAYRITARSDAGEVEATSVAFPLDEQELRYQLQAIELALLRSASETRRLTSELERPVQEFGRQLFDFVLPPQLQANWIAARQRATEREESLRIRLRIGPPKLMALPWEVLFDPYRDDYLSLSTPMVRYLDVFEPRRPLTVTPPLRVLVMTAQPAGLIPLDVEHEKQRLVTALAPLETHGRVRLSWVQDRWHVFHFVGHGGFDRRSSEGRIALADKDGEVDEVPATDLGLLLAKHTSLRLAVLNSCDGARGSTGDRFSSTASVLVRRGIPAVVAMQYEISDQAAVAFAQRFYSALAAQQPVDQAVTDARLAIKRARQNSLEWVTPVIYLRSADGALFDLTDVPVTPPQPSSPVESSDLSAPQREPEPLRPSPLLATPEQESSPKKAALHEVPDDHIYSKPLIPTELTRLAHDSGVYRVADSPDGSPSSPASARQQPESSPTSNSDLDLSEKSSTGQVLKPATFDQQLEPTTKTSDDDVIKLTLYRKSSLSKRSVARRLLILLTEPLPT